MKTLWRYTIAVAGAVTLLVCVKLLIMLPPENTDKFYKGKESGSSILWSGRNDNHDQLRDYGHQKPRLTGEMGRGVVLPVEEKAQGEEALKKYNVNVIASDLVSLNRQVPDSRPVGCESVQYADDLPSTAIVIPFHNEWPSVLLRTVYSIINRTPKALLKQIILVDDASNLRSLKDDLEHFIKEHFPEGLVTLVRMPERVGLIRARLEGFRHVTAEVVSFFDSHMEVNNNWLQPLLVEIVKDRRTVAMGHLDYILPDTFEYSYTPGYRTRYGFDWRLIFFETYFLKSQEKNKDVTDPLPGVVMVGPGFAIRADYFREIGTYDDGMKIWGGENLELAWRVWLCGGRLVHLACSKIGHIARPQPYTFPEGRYETEIFNYKRAVEVWMGPFKKFVYQHHPKMKDLDVGDLSPRIALRDRLQCRNFTWYLKNVWPELYPYGDNATHWGGLRSLKDDKLCLDNNEYLFLGPEPLQIKPCTFTPEAQSFSLTADKRLRSVLQCVGVREEGEDMVPILITCQDEPTPTWTYVQTRQLKHEQTGLCLHLMAGPKLMMQSCKRGEEAQMWKFLETGPPTSLFLEHRPAPGHGKVAANMRSPDGNAKSPRELLDEFEKQMFKNVPGQMGKPAGGMPGAGVNMMQQGTGNMMPSGHGNMMPPGPGDKMPPGAGNLMLPGAGNMMLLLAGNMMPHGAGNMTPPGAGNMIPPEAGNMMPPRPGNMMPPAPRNMPPGHGSMPQGHGNMPQGQGNMAPGAKYMMPSGAENMMPSGAGNMMPPGAGNMMPRGRGKPNMMAQAGAGMQQGRQPQMLAFRQNQPHMPQANQFMNHGNVKAVNPADLMQGQQGNQLQFQPHRAKRSDGEGGLNVKNVQQMMRDRDKEGLNDFVDKPLFNDFRNNQQL